MSRKSDTNVIFTPRNKTKLGKRVYRENHPVALIGPEGKQDTLSVQEFVELLYGQGYQCVIVPPDNP